MNQEESMRYCTICGAEVPEGSVFCGVCGKRLDEVSAASSGQPVMENAGNMRQRKKMHCPVCKGRNLSPTTEAATHQGASYRVTKRVSVGGATTTNKTYWLCADCGKKFRNIPELEEEGKRQRGGAITFAVLAALMALICFFIICFSTRKSPLLLFPFLWGFGVFGALALVFWSRRHRTEKELEYLKANCFD